MISVIVIEYHSLNEIELLSHNFYDWFGKDNEIIVSSNSLYDINEQERIKKTFHSIRWVFNKQNGGFAYGMNEGLRVSRGDVLVVMNPDVKVKAAMVEMVSFLKNNDIVGIIAPKIVDPDGTIQDSLRHYITPWGFIMRHLDGILHKRKLNVKDFREPVSVDWVIGAFMMCRRDFYEKVGGLSDDYFMYCEDMDWCKRAHLAGYDVVYYPETVIEYKGTRAARRSWKYTKIFIKSLLTYWKKYGVR